VKLTTHLHLVPRSRLRGAVPLLPQYVCIRGSSFDLNIWYKIMSVNEQSSWLVYVPFLPRAGGILLSGLFATSMWKFEFTKGSHKTHATLNPPPSPPPGGRKGSQTRRESLDSKNCIQYWRNECYCSAVTTSTTIKIEG
jgi:hypothetical protein